MYRYSPTRAALVVLLALFLVGFAVHNVFGAEKEAPVRAFTFGLWTQHFSGDHTEGINNRLIALEYNHVQVAWFRNSYGNETGFVGAALHTDRYELAKDWWTRANIYGGVMIGYGDHNPVHLGAFSLGIFPTASLGYKDYSLELGATPGMTFLSLKVEF